MCKLDDKIKKQFPNLLIHNTTPWEKLTTLGVGSATPLIAEPKDEFELIALLKFTFKENIPIYVLGGGANTVGTDKEQEHLVISLKQNSFSGFKAGREHVTVGSGIRLLALVKLSLKHNFGGIAPLAGIPGTIGGALRMNAGANGVEMGDITVDISGYHKDGTAWCISNKEKDFVWGYRQSPIPEDVIITTAIFKLKKIENIEAEQQKIDDEIKLRRKKDPKGRSAGCCFRNPKRSLSAGYLIDKAKGKELTSTETPFLVSPQHANFIINQNKGSEKDFSDLLSTIQKNVFNQLGVLLQPEVSFVNSTSAPSLSPLRIVVLKGGNSSERPVSLESGAAIGSALRTIGFDAIEQDISTLSLSEEVLNADVVFPALHGGFGESGEIQELMEKNNIKFVGCSSLSSSIIFDKIISKEVMERHHIPTPRSAIIKPDNTSFPSNLSLPVIVKPPCEGSTFGISKVTTMDEWEDALNLCFQYEPQALIEEFIDGVEATVGWLLGETLPVVEIIPPGEMYDYDAKYTHNLGETQYNCPPTKIKEHIQKQMQKLANDYANAVQARGMVRVDMIIDKHDNIFVIEGNNLPGFTSSSLLPKAAKAAGYSFEELCGKLVIAAARP